MLDFGGGGVSLLGCVTGFEGENVGVGGGESAQACQSSDTRETHHLAYLRLSSSHSSPLASSLPPLSVSLRLLSLSVSRAAPSLAGFWQLHHESFWTPSHHSHLAGHSLSLLLRVTGYV